MPTPRSPQAPRRPRVVQASVPNVHPGRLPQVARTRTERQRPIFAHGERGLQRSITGGRARAGYPPPPRWFVGSRPEWAVYWALSVPLRRLPNVDFHYQASFLGGRAFFGGLVADFLMLDGSRIAINVNGLHWHYERTGQQVIDQAQRVALESVYGVQLIFIDEDQLAGDPVPPVRDALNGIDHSRAGRGL